MCSAVGAQSLQEESLHFKMPDQLKLVLAPLFSPVSPVVAVASD